MEHRWIVLPAAALLMVAGCSDGGKYFKIEGEVEGASGQMIVLEKPDFSGQWLPLDSIRLNSSGKFSIKAPRPGSPDVYRLELDGRYVYFPVDSVGSLELASTLAGFGVDYTLSGTEDAEAFSSFDADLRRHLPYAQNADSARSFKRRVYGKYLQDARGGLLAYHIMTRTLPDGTPLYDLSDPTDSKYLAAVATAYAQYRPNDSHAALLKSRAEEAMRYHNRRTGRHAELSARQIDFPEISLPNEKGEPTSLSSIAGKGNKTLLVFASLTDPDAPARNRELLGKANAGWTIYQVSFDTDQYGWREAASNLPWTTVNDPGAVSDAAALWNVTALPSYFTIDASGNLYDRPASLTKL